MTLTRDQQQLLKTSVGELVRGLEVELEIRQERALTKRLPPDQGGDQYQGSPEKGKPQRWITVRGRHIPLFQGEKVEDALARHFGRKGENAAGAKPDAARVATDADHRRMDRHRLPIYPEPGTPLHNEHFRTELMAEQLHGPEATVGLSSDRAGKEFYAHSADAEGVGHGYQVASSPLAALGAHQNWLAEQLAQVRQRAPGAAVAGQQFGVDQSGHLEAEQS